MEITSEGSQHTIQYLAPEVPDYAGTDFLVVRHVGNTGALQFAATRPTGIAEITFGGIRITTVPPCLDPLDTLQLTFEPTEQPVALAWSTTAGTISQDGLFTAPATPQLVTVTVAWADNPAVSDSIVFQVGGCSCLATILIDGEDIGATRSMSFTLAPDGISGIDWGGGVLGPELSSASLYFFGGAGINIPVGSTTSWQPNLAGVNRGAGYYNPYPIVQDTIPERVTLTITQNDGGNVLSGYGSGRVLVLDGGIQSWSMTFHIEADPIYSSESNRMCRVQ